MKLAFLQAPHVSNEDMQDVEESKESDGLAA